MSNFKNVQPLDDFNWDEFENGTNAGVSKTDLEKAYDETLHSLSRLTVIVPRITSSRAARSTVMVKAPS